jgi:hypothetical protein
LVYVRNALSSQVAKEAMRGVKYLNLHSSGGMPIARACAKNLYTHLGAKSYVGSAANYAWSAVTSSDFVQRNLGSTGAEIFREVGTLVGVTAEECILEQCAVSVFHPLICLLREKVIESQIKGCVGIVLDTGMLWAVGGLNIVGNVKNAVVLADRVATCANLGALAYVYGQPVVKGSMLALQCCSVKSRMREIDRALKDVSLQPLLTTAKVNISEDTAKKTLSTILAIVLESGGLSSTLDLGSLFSDQAILAAMVGIIAAVPSLK